MVSVIIPTYNERGNIAQLIDGVEQTLIRVDHEIIVVDDESPDGTAQVVKKLVLSDRRVRLLSHPPPRDLGKSILMGIMAARGDVIVGMDGDGNHDPRYIPYLIEELQHADLVVASRFINQKIPNPKQQIPNKFKVSKSKIQNIGSFVFNALLRRCLGFPIWDNTSGFYAIRKKMLLSLDPLLIYHGYGEYHLRLLRAAVKKTLRIVEVPVVYPPRIHGQSKSRLGRMVGTYVRTAITGT